jgi:hypothetical protein
MRCFFQWLCGAVAFLLIGNASAQQQPQQIAPNLAPHAAKYTSDVDTLRVARKMKLEESQNAYLRALDAAILPGTAAPDILEALRKERNGVVAGLLAPADPAGLPDEIAAARKVFFNGVGKAAHDFAVEKKKLDDAYLKILAELAKQAKRKGAPPSLGQEVAAEKRRVLTGS